MTMLPCSENVRYSFMWVIGGVPFLAAWTVAETHGKQGLLADVIISDFHAEYVEYPTYDLPTLMAKMFHVAMA